MNIDAIPAPFRFNGQMVYPIKETHNDCSACLFAKNKPACTAANNEVRLHDENWTCHDIIYVADQIQYIKHRLTS